MRNLKDIVDELMKKSSYPRHIVEFHVERLAKKFHYELFGPNKDMLSKEDASDVLSIAGRFLQDRKIREGIKDTATQLLSIIETPKLSSNTKELPVVKKSKIAFLKRLKRE